MSRGHDPIDSVYSVWLKIGQRFTYHTEGKEQLMYFCIYANVVPKAPGVVYDTESAHKEADITDKTEFYMGYGGREVQ